MRFFKTVISIFCLLLLCDTLSATGPSYINAEINPVSVNDKGQVLCRTRYSVNHMGASAVMDVEYGYCLLTGDSIVHLDSHTLKYDMYTDTDLYMEHRKYCDTVFESDLESGKISDLEHDYMHIYGFKDYNVQPFRKDQTMPLKTFIVSRKIDLTRTPQKALYNGTGYYTADEGREATVRLLYDFGNILVFGHRVGEEEHTGCYFDYMNPVQTIYGPEELEFEYSTITGILFVNN